MKKPYQLLTGEQRNWLFMILKALHDTQFDGSFTKKDMIILDSIFATLNLHYDSSDK
jgi:hypothetical protein